MYSYQKKKQERIQSIVSIIKLFLVFVFLIAIFQNYFPYSKILPFNARSLFRSGAMVVIFAVLVAWWTILPTAYKRSPVWLAAIEYTLLFVLSAASVLITENYEYRFHFVFNLLIVAATVERGMVGGFALSAAATSFNLAYTWLRGRIILENEMPVAFAYFIITYTIAYYVNGEREHIDMLTDKVSEDPLSGLKNITAFHSELERAEMSETPAKNLWLIVADVDDFGEYNLRAGHDLGDHALRAIADSLKPFINQTTRIFRYAQDEFALLIRDSDPESVRDIAQKVSDTVCNLHIEHQEKLPSGNLTVSVGISGWPQTVPVLGDLVSSAFDAVSKAKFKKKASIVVYTDIMDEIARILSSFDEQETWVSMKALLAVVNSRDNYTYKHVERVAGYCAEFAREARLSEADKRTLVSAAYLHDIGKLYLPTELLLKTSQLNDEEYALLRTHSERGATLVGGIPSLKDLAGIIRHHHERHNGSGYPDAIAGEEIEYLARVLAVADAFDAMTSPRPYQPRMTLRQGCLELLRCSGQQFDPNVVDLFVGMVLPDYEIAD